MNGLKARTWTYGTKLRGEVASVSGSAKDPKTPRLVVVADDLGEGHMLAGITHDVSPVKGDRVIMQFTKGGPMGGFWRIVEKEVAA